MVLIGLIYMYFNLNNKYNELLYGKRETVDPMALLDAARKRSQKILEDAQVKARETIAKAEQHLDKEDNLIVKELKKAEAEYEASEKLSLSAQQMSGNPTALELRRMQMLSEIGIDNNTTTVIMMPAEFQNAARSFTEFVNLQKSVN